MGKKKKRHIIICMISGLTVIAVLIYMGNNEYRKIAWNALSKEQKQNVIGGRYLSYVKTIKPKDRYILPDNPACNMVDCVYDEGGYIVKDEILIVFKKGVPDIIRRIKIALMDGVIVDDRLIKDMNMYTVRIDGIGVNKLNKLMDKLGNDSVVSAAYPNGIYTTMEVDYGDSKGSENIKNKKVNVVTFSYFKEFRLRRYIVYIDKESGKEYVIDTEEPLSALKSKF